MGFASSPGQWGSTPPEVGSRPGDLQRWSRSSTLPSYRAGGLTHTFAR
jgi:hypothetical protein